MKYSIIFAATAAAYDAYGAGGYVSSKSSSSSKTSTSCTTGSYPTTAVYGGYDKPSIKTITVGYGKPPVTITSVYQPYETCGSSKDKKSCDKWVKDAYVSTVIKDCDNKDVTITRTNQVVTVYRTKTTVTNYATATPTVYKKTDYLKDDCVKDTRYNTTPDYRKACDKSIKWKNYDASCKSNTSYNTSSKYRKDCDKSFEYKSWCAAYDSTSGKKEWYSLYEKSYEVKFVNLGPYALKGYPGSGLRKDLHDKQPVHVREYKDGKWTQHKRVLKFGTPQSVKVYEKPGVYTNPSKDVYVYQPVTKGSEAYVTAKAGTPVTYGGVYSEVTAPCTITGAYGAYQTSVVGGKTITSTVVKTVTVVCAKAGKCEIAKPTVTVYQVDTKVAYPTAKVYQPGVYHYDAETITITKPNQPYTCEYKQTKTYDVSKQTGSSSNGNNNGWYGWYDDSQWSTVGTPKINYPSSSTKKDSEYGYGYQPSSTPSVYTQTTPSGGEYGYGYKPSSTPAAYVNTVKTDYPSYPSSTPSYNNGNPTYDTPKSVVSVPYYAPSVSAPVYSAPAVSAPAVSAPAASAPAVSAPAVSAPAVSAPAVSAPAVSAPADPVSSAPAASAPAVSAPAVSAPAVSAPADPVSSAPAVSAPAVSAPAVSAPADPVSSAPAASAPAVSAPAVSAPAVSAPADPVSSAPAASAPAASAPADPVPSGAGDDNTTPDAPVPVTKRSFSGSFAARARRAM